MKKLIFLIAIACTLFTTGCEKNENGGKGAVSFDKTEVVKLQATRAELKTTGFTVESKEARIKNVGVRYRVAGDNDWTTALGTLDADGKGFTTQLAGLTEHTDYEYCAWIAGIQTGSAADSQIGSFTTRRYYEIEYESVENIKGISATLYFSGIKFYENGIETPMERYTFSYRPSGSAEWSSFDLSLSDEKFAIDLTPERLLTEETTYEYRLSCNYYSKMVTDTYEHTFKTVKAELAVSVLATSIVGKGDGVLCVAEVIVSIDGPNASSFDGCSADYREKGTSTWKNAEGTKLSEQTLQAFVPVAQLTAGKNYEYRFNVVRNQTTWTDTEVYEFRYAAQEISKIAGQWRLDSFNNQNNLPYVIYLDVTETNRLSLYQHMTQAGYEHFVGTISVMNDTVSGIYDDGVLWGTSYKLEIVDAQTMKWTDAQNSADVSIYKRTTIPDGIAAAPQAAPGTGTTSTGERFL